jgi:hypothetical protein
MSDIWKNNLKKHKTEYFKNVRKEILEQINNYEKAGKRFNKEDVPERMNSYERNLYIPLYSNELLIENVEYYLKQAWGEFEPSWKYTLDGSYNDALKHTFIHLLLKRLKEKMKENNKIEKCEKCGATFEYWRRYPFKKQVLCHDCLEEWIDEGEEYKRKWEESEKRREKFKEESDWYTINTKLDEIVELFQGENRTPLNKKICELADIIRELKKYKQLWVQLEKKMDETRRVSDHIDVFNLMETMKHE